MLFEFSEHENLRFHLLVICFLISDTASVLSNTCSIDISGLLISEAASFACLSANSFPSISLCPGTQCTLILLFLSQIFPKLFLMSNTSFILFFGRWLINAVLIAGYNQLVYEWAYFEYFPILKWTLVLFEYPQAPRCNCYWLDWHLSLITLWYFYIHQYYATAPAPIGPGFPKAEPSVNNRISWSVLWVKNL